LPALIESCKQPSDGTPGIDNHLSCEFASFQRTGYGVPLRMVLGMEGITSRPK
jgi:hypothetical protein